MTTPDPNSDAERVKEILAEALELPVDQRAGFIAAQTQGRADLGQRVRELVEALESEDGFMADVTLPASDLPPDHLNPASRLAEGAGDTIGRYKLLEQIGEGGFGVVFRAQQTEPVRRNVALKIIKLGLDTERVVKRFEAERQALAMMDHPNIARVFDGAATETGRPYFVMELVRGVPITEYCEKHQLDLHARLELFGEVCSAVQHAHHKGVIHRDLKPNNVLVTVIDSKPVPKVIDFGISKATSSHLTEQTMFTEFRQLIGTPEYMSPEQADPASADIDTRTDVYSLGVLLYELLTGQTPFEGKRLRSAAVGELQRIIREEDPPRPSTRLTSAETPRREHPARAAAKLAEELRGELDWIIMKAIDKDRTRRYDTAAGFARDVQRYLEGEPIEARPASATYRFSKFAKRHKGTLTTAAVVSAAVVIGLVASVLGWAEASRQTTVAKEQIRETQVVLHFLTGMLNQAKPEKMGRDVRVAEVLDTAAESLIAGVYDVPPKIEARLHHTICSTYLSLGMYDKAEFHARAAVEIRNEIFGLDHVDTLEITANLVSILHSQGLDEQVEPMSDELIARLEGLLETDPETANAVYFGAANTHGLIKRAMQDFETALRYERIALEASTEMYGPDHRKTIGILQNIATTLNYLDRNDEAMEVALDAVERAERALGEDSKEAILAREAVANQNFRTGKPGLAVPVYERNIASRKVLLGDDHPSTLTSIYNFAAVNFQLGDREKAQVLLLEVLRSVPGKLPFTHRVAMSAAALAGPEYIPADGSEPEDPALARVILDTLAANTGSPYLLMDFGNGAASALVQGRHLDPAAPGKALEITSRVIEHATENDHPSLAYYLDTHAHALFYSGDTAGAIEAQRRAVEVCPEDQPEMLAELSVILQAFEDGRDPNSPES